jgi:hypothetical protein
MLQRSSMWVLWLDYLPLGLCDHLWKKIWDSSLWFSLLSHAMSTNLVNSCILNVVLSVHMIIRVDICIESLNLKVFGKKMLFSHFCTVMARQARQISPWRESGNRIPFFNWMSPGWDACRQREMYVARAGMAAQERVNDSFWVSNDSFLSSFSMVYYKYKSLQSNGSLSLFKPFYKD